MVLLPDVPVQKNVGAEGKIYFSKSFGGGGNSVVFSIFSTKKKPAKL